MANAVALQRNSPASNPDSVLLKVTPSGAYAAGGDLVNLTPSSWSDPSGEGVIGPWMLPPLPPEISVANAGGYRAEWVPGTDLLTGKLKWYTGSAAGAASTELAAGAYPAAITGSTIVMRILLKGA